MRGSLFTKFVFAGVVLAAAVTNTAVTSYSQAQRPADQQKPDQVTVNTGEVRLDVVVRDKSGRLKKDLTAKDFEVYEDGVRQDISSLQLTSGENESARRGNQRNSASESANPVFSCSFGCSVRLEPVLIDPIYLLLLSEIVIPDRARTEIKSFRALPRRGVENYPSR